MTDDEEPGNESVSAHYPLKAGDVVAQSEEREPAKRPKRRQAIENADVALAPADVRIAEETPQRDPVPKG